MSHAALLPHNWARKRKKAEWGIEKDLLKSRIYFPFVVPSQKLGDINDHPHVIIFLRGDSFLPSFFSFGKGWPTTVA